MKNVILLVLVVALFLLSGCAGLFGNPESLQIVTGDIKDGATKVSGQISSTVSARQYFHTQDRRAYYDKMQKLNSNSGFSMTMKKYKVGDTVIIAPDTISYKEAIYLDAPAQHIKDHAFWGWLNNATDKGIYGVLGHQVGSAIRTALKNPGEEYHGPVYMTQSKNWSRDSQTFSTEGVQSSPETYRPQEEEIDYFFDESGQCWTNRDMRCSCESRLAGRC